MESWPRHLNTHALLAAAAVAASWALSGPINAFPCSLLSDDGYFYTQIAYHLGTTGRSTFDGIHTTSGYHLAWCALLAVVSAAVGLITDSRPAHLVAHQAVWLYLAAALSVVFGRTWLQRACLFGLCLFGTMMMETALLAVVLLAMGAFVLRGDEGPPTREWMLANLAFLVAFVRVDAALIALVFGLGLVVAGDRQRGAAAASGALGGAFAQMAVMWGLFGHPFSVSSMHKVDVAGGSLEVLWHNLMGHDGFQLGFLMRAGVVAFLATAAVLLLASNLRCPTNRRLLALCAGVAVYTAGHFCAHLMPLWCYLPAFVVLFFAVIRAELPDGALWPRVRTAVVLVTAATMALFLAHKARRYVHNAEVIAATGIFAEDLGRHVPADQRIFQFDSTGYTSWFSGRTVVNGDGLVNSYDYLRRYLDDDLGTYLDDEDICYVVTTRHAGGDRVLSSNGLVVRRDEVDEVARTATYGRFPSVDLVLWVRPVCSTNHTPMR